MRRSFFVKGRDQQEMNYFWDKLAHVKEAEQCGWVKVHLACRGKLFLTI